MSASADRNLRLYPVYQSLRNGMFWLPIFFLYFMSVLSLEEALLLEAIYYLAVVLLEVPSGAFSDRVGRCVTLRIAMACLVLASTVFAATASFGAFVLGQALMAAGVALNSGSDSSLLYDSLREAGREHEIGAREAHATSRGLAAVALAAAIGGAVAGFDLRIAWVLTAVASAGAFAVAWRFSEPRPDPERASGRRAVRGALARLEDPALRWVSAYAVGMVVLNHVPYEFYQPYLKLLFADLEGGDYAVTPAVSGALTAAMMGLGAAASARAMIVRARLGVAGSLLACMAVQIAIVLAMASWLNPFVMLAVLMRSVPMGVLAPIVNAEIHPRIPSGVRATYLSLQSLVGRLAFSGCLALASRALADGPGDHAAMANVLAAFALGGCALAAILALTTGAWRTSAEA